MMAAILNSAMLNSTFLHSWILVFPLQVWVNLRGNTKIQECKKVEFNMAEFKMAAIIKLSENEWVWVRLN